MDMTTICADLKDELEALDAIVSPLDETAWNRLTPAEGWTVRDQIVHIGGTDRAALGDVYECSELVVFHRVARGSPRGVARARWRLPRAGSIASINDPEGLDK